MPPAPAAIDQRFAVLLKQLGLTKNAFAQSLGKTASVVQHLLDGRNKPGFDLLHKIFQVYPNVSKDWLLMGRGPMLLRGQTAQLLPEAAEADEAEATAFAEALTAAALPTATPAARANGAAPEAGGYAPATTTVAAAAVAAALNGHVVPERPARPPGSNGAAMPVAAPAPEAASAPPVAAEAAPAPAPAAPVVPPASVVLMAPAVAPEAYLASALNAQHLQHQLALAELRNQHLLEQQALLRELLEMAKGGSAKP